MRSAYLPDLEPDGARFAALARAITADIERGRLTPGERLPGSRTLAQRLDLSRNTVVRAYRELEAEGWLVAVSLRPEDVGVRPQAALSAEVRAAVRAAQSLGADVVGLGAFTSIVTRNGRDLSDVPGCLTSGNAFTFHFYDGDDDGLPQHGAAELVFVNGWPELEPASDWSW